jgi:NAD(P)-dependent dehydrogenase (short-subunit alcohol dehydrogenase family)
MRVDLFGRVALVTGAAEGIGRGCAEVLGEAGAHVIVVDVQEDAGARCVRELADRGASAEFLAADVADESAVAGVAEAVRSRHGRLNALVNNAGVEMFKGVADTTPADWDRLMAVDLRGIYLVTRALLPLLEAGRPASVVSIASVHARLTIPTMTAYAAAKGAVVSMTRSLAQELGPRGIRVNAVSPGFVHTSMVERWLATEPDRQAAIERVNRLLPVGRMATPADVGHLVAFLSSERAACITGGEYVIDGGLTARLHH